MFGSPELPLVAFAELQLAFAGLGVLWLGQMFGAYGGGKA